MIGLVACSSRKLGRAATARELYESPLFKLSLADAERTCTAVYVMSAKHGLVHLDETIEPYDVKLGERGWRDRWQWARTLLDRLETLHPEQPDIAIYGGRLYVDPIRTEAANPNARWSGAFSEPLEGLQIGERLRFLQQRAAKADRTRSAA
jgi:hypothetical protein